MNATIITIGDEILVGQTVDTNSAHIAKELNALGIKISEIVSISDTENHIKQTLDKTIPVSDFVIVTGGLGPTNDDITKTVLTEYFDDELVINEDILARIKDFFVKFNKPFLEVNQLQAMLPEKATIIQNDLGTASGMWFHESDCNVLSLPGVPYEMKGLLAKFITEIKTKFPLGDFYHQTLQITGIGESYLANLLEDWEKENREKEINVSYLPAVGTLKLRLTGRIDQKNFIDAQMEFLKATYPKYVLGGENDTIEKVIKKIFTEQNITLGTVESCTGGSIAKKIVGMPGSSAFYLGSIVSYTNELKEALVGVKKETLINNGAVSEAVVLEMAINGRQKLGVDYCISVSGIAGPSGGSEEKPVGTVWIAIAGPNGQSAKRFNYGHTRNRNIKSSVQSSLNYLRLIVTNQLD